MKTAVIYYSLTGNTRSTARKIAEKTGADLLEIQPEKAYPDKGAKKFLWGGKSAVMKEQPVLVPYSFSAEEYDLIVIGFPVWASTFAPPVRTFVHENLDALKTKRIAAFACFAGGGADKAFEKLRKYLEINRFEKTLVLIDPADRPDPSKDAQIDLFCAALNEG